MCGFMKMLDCTVLSIFPTHTPILGSLGGHSRVSRSAAPLAHLLPINKPLQKTAALLNRDGTEEVPTPSCK